MVAPLLIGMQQAKRPTVFHRSMCRVALYTTSWHYWCWSWRIDTPYQTLSTIVLIIRGNMMHTRYHVNNLWAVLRRIMVWVLVGTNTLELENMSYQLLLLLWYFLCLISRLPYGVQFVSLPRWPVRCLVGVILKLKSKGEAEQNNENNSKN